MAKGDHLRVCHGVYYHHGIDMGDGSVIHFGTGSKKKTNPKIDRVPLETFAGGKEIEIVDSVPEFEPDEICRRAEARLSQTDYKLFGNNCEHFASWCREGEHRSSQVWKFKKVAQSAGSAAIKAVASGSSPIAKTVAGSLRSVLPSALKVGLPKISPWLMLADAAELSSSQMSQQLGFEEKKSQQIGQVAGVATSAGVGFLVAGPVGAAANVCLWKSTYLISKKMTDWAFREKTPDSIASASPENLTKTL